MSTLDNDILSKIAAGEVFTEVNLSNLGLTEFPLELLKLHDSLEMLNMGGNHLSTLPPEFDCFTKLRILFFAGNRFETIPECLGRLPSLYMVSFKGNKLSTISPTSLSPSIGWLILTDNCLTELPETVGNLRGLRKLMLANNDLHTLPPTLSHCKELELIRLSRNKLSTFPSFLLSLPKLSWLSLAGNNIPGIFSSTLPPQSRTLPVSSLAIGPLIGEGASGYVYEVQRKQQLVNTYGTITGNSQGALLKSVETCSSPPVCDTSNMVPSVMDQLSISDGRFLAYKQFKGQCGSDGSSQDEIVVSLSVSYHSHMLCPIACIIEDPPLPPVPLPSPTTIAPQPVGILSVPESSSCDDSRSHSSDSTLLTTPPPLRPLGLLFPLLPPTCTSLGGPPSFRSVTRDVYDPQVRYSLDFIVRVGQGMASAGQHLHDRGILHGDLYAHNIHVYPDGTPVLMDFGASFQCDVESLAEEFTVLQRHEVRAFGCLLEELLDRVIVCTGALYAENGSGGECEQAAGRDGVFMREGKSGERQGTVVDMSCLMKLRDACLQENILLRPSFQSICQQLDIPMAQNS